MDIAIEELKVLSALREDEVVGKAFAVVQEVILDDIAAVTEAENEIAVAVVRVVLHDMPEERAVPNVDHRFGDMLGVVSEPHPEATAK